MGPFLKNLAAFLATLVLAGGLVVGGRSLWMASRSTGQLAGVLMEDIRSFLADATDVVENPFVEHALGPEPIFVSRIALERDLARRILGGFWTFHLSGSFVHDLSMLSSFDSARLENYYRSVRGWALALRVPPPAPQDLLEWQDPLLQAWARIAPERKPPATPAISPAVARARLAELAAADRLRLEAARARAPQLQAEWTGDRTTYCRSMLALRRMTEIESAQREGCKAQAPEGKPMPSCTRAALARFSSQVRELEQVRTLNERKLKEKWSPRLYAQISCD
jgi:hypothetical protein